MHAAKLNKGNKASKNKIKKTIKNILCRPDTVSWPLLTEEHGKILETALEKHRIKITEFKKQHWNELKLIPKEKRPKAPKIQKVNGFFFGISECLENLKTRDCSAILVESNVNPRTIVQPFLELCADSEIPVACLNGLRKTSASYFGIATSCLGIKKHCVDDVSSLISELGHGNVTEKSQVVQKVEVMNENVEVDGIGMDIQKCPYLYRTNKKSRVFVPPTGQVTKPIKDFTGQNFIEISKANKETDKTYMKMLVKRTANNPARVKLK